jgi:DNA-binding transcriptional ArsR family regulator
VFSKRHLKNKVRPFAVGVVVPLGYKVAITENVFIVVLKTKGGYQRQKDTIMPPEKDNTIQIKRLANETEYFTNVFKRTEKIVSVVFYVLSQIHTKKDNEVYSQILKDRGLKTHEVALGTLRLQTQEAAEGLLTLQYALVDLESTLRISEAAGFLPQNIAELLFEQLLTVQRYLTNNYIKQPAIDMEGGLLITDVKGKAPIKAKPPASLGAAPVRRKSVQIPTNDISSDAYFVYSQMTDRAERIKTVLEAKPHATIKDISEIITDVSEKTIQRELNSLIEKGQVVREGERRWSRYSVQK